MIQKTHIIRPTLLVLLLSGTMMSVFAAGLGAGLYFHPHFLEGEEYHSSDAEHDAHHELAAEEEKEPHVALTRQAFDNLGLRLGRVTHGDYWKSILLPAEIVEIPGRSNRSISAPVTGVVEQVRILPGEAVTLGQTLFVIRITDEELTSAQTKLLSVLTRQEVARQEIQRLDAVIQSGAVAGKRARELDYELQQLVAEQETLTQQLLGRGLPEPVVRSVLQDRTLATTLEVLLPEFAEVAPDDEANYRGGSHDTSGYSVEDLRVHPGKSIQRGEMLCSLAYHTELYIQGTAFESDLDVLKRIAENGWTMTATTHASHTSHTSHAVPDSPILLDNLRLLRIDNHVDEQTQTIRFFVLLKNRREQSFSETNGRRYEQWQFRAGQRIHLRLPVEKWEDQITLPADALVVDGPHVYVFAEHRDDQEEEEEGHHDVFVELEPVPVRLLHRDESSVVVARDVGFAPEVRIALNQAYKLHMALRMQAGSGGGHHHHDH